MLPPDGRDRRGGRRSLAARDHAESHDLPLGPVLGLELRGFGLGRSLLLPRREHVLDDRARADVSEEAGHDSEDHDGGADGDRYTSADGVHPPVVPQAHPVRPRMVPVIDDERCDHADEAGQHHGDADRERIHDEQRIVAILLVLRLEPDARRPVAEQVVEVVLARVQESSQIRAAEPDDQDPTDQHGEHGCPLEEHEQHVERQDREGDERAPANITLLHRATTPLDDRCDPLGDRQVVAEHLPREIELVDELALELVQAVEAPKRVDRQLRCTNLLPLTMLLVDDPVQPGDLVVVDRLGTPESIELIADLLVLRVETPRHRVGGLEDIRPIQAVVVLLGQHVLGAVGTAGSPDDVGMELVDADGSEPHERTAVLEEHDLAALLTSIVADDKEHVRNDSCILQLLDLVVRQTPADVQDRIGLRGQPGTGDDRDHGLVLVGRNDEQAQRGIR